jgi:hypothetical protein
MSQIATPTAAKPRKPKIFSRLAMRLAGVVIS